jgi:hypothetical protein
MTEKPPLKEATPIQVFQLNDEEADFEELEINKEMKLFELLKPNAVLYFVDADNYKSYIWSGSQTSTRMKFIAAQKAPNVRDKIGPAIKLVSVDEGEETLGFKVLIGLEKPIEYKKEQKGPAYLGRAEDDKLLEELSLEKIILLLEKIGCPEGYKREMVIDGKNIYGFQTIYREYLGQLIEEKKLYRLQDTVPDGLYMVDGLVSRILLSYNRVVILELLRKLSPEEIEKEKKKQEKIAQQSIAAPFTQ